MSSTKFQVTLDFTITEALSPEEAYKIQRTLHRAVYREADKVYSRQDPKGIFRATFEIRTTSVRDGQPLGKPMTKRDY